MTRLVLVLLVACGTGRSPTPRHDPVVSDAGSTSGSATAVTGARARRIEAPHGAAIVALATTPDGMAAVSVDDLGGVRLWPALDGSIEPRVVDLAPPELLAIVRRDAGFAIASIDSAGGLAITQVDRDGLTQSRVAFSVDIGFAGVLAIERGFLAWRVDQRILKLTASGAVAHELAAEPGQRIAALAVAGGRAIAAIDSAHPVRRARWITLGARLAWGGLIDSAPVGTQLALSPSGRRFAFLTDTREVRVFDTTDGTAVASDKVATGLALAMPDDDHVALAHPGGSVFWLALASGKQAAGPVAGFPPEARPLPLAVGGHGVIAAHQAELVIASRDKTAYLGYRLTTPAVASAGPSGGLLLGLGTTFAQLDPTLTASHTAPDLMIPEGSSVADLRWLGGDEWLVESSRSSDGVSAIALVDTRQKRSVAVRSGMAMVQMLMHEPSSKLVTLSLGDPTEVLRHEPGQRLVKVSALPKPAGFEQARIVPLAPKLSGGVHLVVIHQRERIVIRWVPDPRALDRGVTMTVDGSLAAVDAAGHVYVWQTVADGSLELVILANGKRVGTLPSDGSTALFPDREGTRVLQVSQRSVSLLTLDGATVWTLPIHGVNEAVWLGDGGLAIISAVGVARLDPATGEAVAARCGWHFGLADRPHPGAPRLEPLCTQLR